MKPYMWPMVGLAAGIASVGVGGVFGIALWFLMDAVRHLVLATGLFSPMTSIPVTVAVTFGLLGALVGGLAGWVAIWRGLK